MIESNDLTEGLVLTVQARQEALKCATQLVSEVPACLLGGDPPDVVLAYATRFQKWIETGRS